MLINIIQIITIMKIKIISKNKTNKHIFFLFLLDSTRIDLSPTYLYT